MSSKIVFGVVAVVIIAVLGVYFSGKEKAVAPTSNTTAQSTESTTSALVPGKESSSDSIVDYLIDGLSSDEEMTTKATLDTRAPSQVDSSNSLNTNF